MEHEEHLLWVMRDWRHLARVSVQTSELCFEALKGSSWALPLIKNPTQEMVDIAVEKNPNVIKWVPSELQNEALWLSVVSRDGLLLLAAVSRDITGFVDRPLPPRKEPVGVTTKVICAAVSQNCEALKWVPPTDENIASLQALPAMAKLDVFQFILTSRGQVFYPMHVLEKFLNLEGVDEQDVKPLLKLLVKHKRTRLLVRFLNSKDWNPEEKNTRIRSAMSMVRGHLGLAEGSPHSEFVTMLHALKTLLTGSRARSLLNEMDGFNLRSPSESNSFPWQKPTFLVNAPPPHAKGFL